MDNILLIARKELSGIFSSLTAYIFLGSFLFVTLFVFFWAEPFFARNIADVRPMFEWMPALLTFLVPALTMRMWSEERRTGTLELLLTAPISNVQLVAGKFVACLLVVCVALLLTLSIPITVSYFLGNLDWGPVLAAYIAAVLLAATYTSIGLYISTRSDNQIVCLILSVFACGCFLLVGSEQLASLFNDQTSHIMMLLGTGSRFQSVARGVIDLRDLYYYLSIAGVFISLNILSLEKLRWAGNRLNAGHRASYAMAALAISNFVVANFWLAKIDQARVDVTRGQNYVISKATRKYLDSLNEPLLIRGYFSKRTHPALAPLVPQLHDLLKEYALAGHGKVHVEFVDPAEHPQLEKEAIQKYDIKGLMFQAASKYQASLNSSYFDILIKSGDEFQKLSLETLVEFKANGEKGTEFALRSPEYDITSSIKRVLSNEKSMKGNLFDGVVEPLTFVAYVSADNKLPTGLQQLKSLLKTVLLKWEQNSHGKLKYEFVDPDADQGRIASQISSEFGLKPMALSAGDPNPFWFYMMLKDKEQVVQIALPEELNQKSLETGMNSALKRFSKLFMKTLGICTSVDGHLKPPDYNFLRLTLAKEYWLKWIFTNTAVPPYVNVMLLLAPEKMTEQDMYSVDQFLMRGGTLILNTAPFFCEFKEAPECHKTDSGVLEQWLSNYGIDVQKSMVLDPQYFPLVVPVARKVDNMVIREPQIAPYPYFVDLREDGMSKTDNICSGLKQELLAFASPISIDKEKNSKRRVIDILHSTSKSWTSKETDIDPKYTDSQQLGFQTGKDQGSRLLAVALEGPFSSYYKDKNLPWLEKDKALASHFLARIDKTEQARIILISTNTFLTDNILGLATTSQNIKEYKNPIQLIQNLIDWSLEDRDLSAIRGRSHFAQVLKQTEASFQMFFEYLNYGIALTGLTVVFLIHKFFADGKRKRYKRLLERCEESRAVEEIKS